MNPVPGFWGAAGLLIRLRFRRLLNLQARAMTPVGKDGKRKATPGKVRQGLTSGFLMLVMLGSQVIFAVLQLAEMEKERSLVGLALPLAAAVLVQRVVTSFILSLAASDLGQGEWDLEWLSTLPVPRRALVAARLLERTLVNPACWLFLPTQGLGMALWSGHTWTAPVGVLLALPVQLALTAAVMAVEFRLRMRASGDRRRNLQAVLGIVGLLLTMGTMFTLDLTQGPGALLVRLAPFMDHTPFLAMVVALKGPTGWDQLLGLGTLLAWCGVITAVAVALVLREIADGVAGQGARESARGKARVKPWRLPSFLTPVQRRELVLLARDRNYLTQTVVMPILLLGLQYLNPAMAAFGTPGPAAIGTLAFLAASYAQIFSSQQILNGEGNSLWLLYTFPRPLEAVVREKILLWAGYSLLLSCAVLAWGLRGVPAEAAAPVVAVTLVGVGVQAITSGCLGVFASDPLAQDIQRKVRPEFTFLAMVLAGLYLYTFHADGFFQKVAQLVLSSMLALGLWQRLKDRLPYLLDPTTEPPPRVSLVDGLVAAQFFLVFQGMFLVLFVGGFEWKPHAALFGAFALSGALVGGLFRAFYWRRGFLDVPTLLGGQGGWGVVLACALPAILFGGTFQEVVRHSPYFPGAFGEDVPTSARPWIAALAVGAAPLFEEFIFRGLVFGGLRRSLPLRHAVLASAALFAVIHPPASVVPVFGLGVATALAYQRAGALWAPVAVHALYNAAVLGLAYLR